MWLCRSGLSSPRSPPPILADVSGLREQPTNPQPHVRPKTLSLLQLSSRVSMPLRARRALTDWVRDLGGQDTEGLHANG